MVCRTLAPVADGRHFTCMRECFCVRRGLWKLTSTMINFSDTMAETGFLVRALFTPAALACTRAPGDSIMTDACTERCHAKCLAAQPLSALLHDCPALLHVKEPVALPSARAVAGLPDALRASAVMPFRRWAQALAAALVILFVLCLRRRYTINPASVYRCGALQELAWCAQESRVRRGCRRVLKADEHASRVLKGNKFAWLKQKFCNTLNTLA